MIYIKALLLATVTDAVPILVACCRGLGISEGIERALPYIAINFAGALAAVAYTSVLNS